MTKHKRYFVKNDARSPVMGSFQFDTNTTSDPSSASFSDPSGMLTSVAYSATGVLTCTLSDKFATLHAQASIDDFANHQATVTGTSASAGTITIQISDHADPQAAEAPGAADTVTVFYSASR